MITEAEYFFTKLMTEACSHTILACSFLMLILIIDILLSKFTYYSIEWNMKHTIATDI